MYLLKLLLVFQQTTSLNLPQQISREHWIEKYHKEIVKNLERQPPYEPIFTESDFKEINISDEEKVELDKIKGSLLGLAIGDTYGAFYEWKKAEDIEKIYNKNKDEFRKLRPKNLYNDIGYKISFTDDTSMALCLASSLIIKEGFDEYDQLVRYSRWITDHYMTSHGVAHGAGSTTKNSLAEFRKRREALFKKMENELKGITRKDFDVIMTVEEARKNGFNTKCDVGNKHGMGEGNGSLMRLAPVPLFYYRDEKKAIKYARKSSLTTHSGKVSADICKIFAAYICRALNEKNIDKKELLNYDSYVKQGRLNDKDIDSTLKEVARADYHNKTMTINPKTAALTIETFKVVLWAFVNDGDKFETGMIKLVKLGGDTDTTCAIYGQLAGAFYGYEQIPADWKTDLPFVGFFEEIAVLLYLYGEKSFANLDNDIGDSSSDDIIMNSKTNTSNHTSNVSINQVETKKKEGISKWVLAAVVGIGLILVIAILGGLYYYKRNKMN